jgi:cytochrome c
MKHHVCTCARGKRARTTMSVVLTCFSVFVVAMAVITTPGAVSVNAANAGDPMRGKDLFEKRCGGCHSLDANKEGPQLRNVYGRKAGSISSFKYSDALKGAQFMWDQNSLDKWLTNTESVIPDNDMDFHVPKADERADIIEYLRVSSGK